MLKALLLTWSVLLNLNVGEAVPATLGVPCWADICEFQMMLTLGHTLTRNTPGQPPEELELQAGGCVKVKDSPPLSPCLDITSNQVSSNIVTADGRARNVLLVNGQFPGPTIEVMEGSTVIVHVRNSMSNIVTSIHWHGMTQKGTPSMDGAAFITQCPIPPRHTFTYRFKATPSGTTWYHPHMANLRSDGHYGVIIVHKDRPTISELPLLISDWFPLDGIGEPLVDYRAGTDGETPDPVSALINGRGRHMDTPQAPLSRFQVQPGQRYRFRCANAASDSPFVVSVDGQTLTIVAWDGNELRPLQVDMFNVFPGERVDFEIVAVSTSLWIRAKSLNTEASSEVPDNEDPIVGYGVLSSSNSNSDPTSQPTSCTAASRCRVFNCFKEYTTAEYRVCVDLEDIQSEETTEVQKFLGSPVRDIFMNVAGNIGDSINGKRFVTPVSPFYQPYPQDLISCQVQCISTNDVCWCTHGVSVSYNNLVQIVFSNMESDSDEGHEGHPMHIHGHRFAVVAHGFATYDSQTGAKLGNNPAIRCDSEVCRNPSWNQQPPVTDFHLDNPPLKDTVIVPPGGYVVLRLRADNPGYWLVHCHLLKDMIGGMALYLEVAPGKVPPQPQQLPPCSPLIQKQDRVKESDRDFNFKRKERLSRLELMGLILGYVAICVLLVVGVVMLALCCFRCRRRVSTNQVGGTYLRQPQMPTGNSGPYVVRM